MSSMGLIVGLIDSKSWVSWPNLVEGSVVSRDSFIAVTGGAVTTPTSYVTCETTVLCVTEATAQHGVVGFVVLFVFCEVHLSLFS